MTPERKAAIVNHVAHGFGEGCGLIFALAIAILAFAWWTK